MPDDFAYRFFQTAHANLILPQLRGDEAVHLDGLIPGGGTLAFKLPGVALVAHHEWFDGRAVTARLTQRRANQTVRRLMIPVSFASSHVDLDWLDISWGHEHGLLSWEEVVAYANADAHRREDVATKLSTIDKSSAHENEYILRSIEGYSNVPNKKWLYICVSCFSKNRASLRDPFGDVERIFADFGYPDEIASFIGFMPPTDGYNPTIHTEKQNYDRLKNNWRDFVERGYRG